MWSFGQSSRKETLFAKDQLPLSERRDVLVFQTEPLPNDVEVTGPLVVTLYVSSDANVTAGGPLPTHLTGTLAAISGALAIDLGTGTGQSLMVSDEADAVGPTFALTSSLHCQQRSISSNNQQILPGTRLNLPEGYR